VLFDDEARRIATDAYTNTHHAVIQLNLGDNKSQYGRLPSKNQHIKQNKRHLADDSAQSADSPRSTGGLVVRVDAHRVSDWRVHNPVAAALSMAVRPST
jgi:hypothetical protein